MKLSGPPGHQMANYDLADPEDFLAAVKSGVVWKLGDQTSAQKAYDMIQAGTIPIAECQNIPANIAAALKGSKTA